MDCIAARWQPYPRARLACHGAYAAQKPILASRQVRRSALHRIGRFRSGHGDADLLEKAADARANVASRGGCHLRDRVRRAAFDDHDAVWLGHDERAEPRLHQKIVRILVVEVRVRGRWVRQSHRSSQLVEKNAVVAGYLEAVLNQDPAAPLLAPRGILLEAVT